MLINDMEKNSLTVVKCLCSEFQALWLVDVETGEMITYKFNPEKAIPGTEGLLSIFSNYEMARKWYIERFVNPKEKDFAYNATSLETIKRRLATESNYYVEYTRVHDDVSNFNQLFYSKVDDGSDELHVFVIGFRDIDSRKSIEFDELTGLYNRQAFIKHAEELMSNYPNVEFDIIMSDYVDFKKINEIYGTKTGDDILRWTGNFLKMKTAGIGIVGRFGGDRFATIMPHEKMMKVLGNSDEELGEQVESNLPKVTPKFGIYLNVKRDVPIIVQCDKAHAALNSIKHKYGEIYAIYDEKLKTEIKFHRFIEEHMHTALEEKQFKVYYQPKHDALTGKLMGAEALVRWIHPEFGFMSPGDFIPIFEHNGFIKELDAYVWRTVCEDIQRWLENGLEVVPISVNASKLTIDDDGYVSSLERPVKKFRVPREYLHVEITESLMENDVSALIDKMNIIKELGYKFELDDFGAGYSSINIMSTLPIDIVKLDMSFIKQYGVARRTKVIAACINLAKNLGYETISEGVETKEQLNALRTLGVDAVQGYYYSKPLPEAEYLEYMKNNIE